MKNKTRHVEKVVLNYKNAMSENDNGCIKGKRPKSTVTIEELNEESGQWEAVK